MNAWCEGITERHFCVTSDIFVMRLVKLRLGQDVRNRMISRGRDILPVHDRKPARLAEQLVVMPIQTGVLAIDGDPLRKTLRNLPWCGSSSRKENRHAPWRGSAGR